MRRVWVMGMALEALRLNSSFIIMLYRDKRVLDLHIKKPQREIKRWPTLKPDDTDINIF